MIDEPLTEEERELREYELDRERRRRRRNRVCGRLVAWIMVVVLAQVTYDSVQMARSAHESGDSWLYPAALAALAGGGALLLLVVSLRTLLRLLRRLRAPRPHREPAGQRRS